MRMCRSAAHHPDRPLVRVAGGLDLATAPLLSAVLQAALAGR